MAAVAQIVEVTETSHSCDSLISWNGWDILMAAVAQLAGITEKKNLLWLR